MAVVHHKLRRMEEQHFGRPCLLGHHHPLYVQVMVRQPCCVQLKKVAQTKDVASTYVLGRQGMLITLLRAVTFSNGPRSD